MYNEEEYCQNYIMKNVFYNDIDRFKFLLITLSFLPLVELQKNSYSFVENRRTTVQCT